MFTKWVIDIEGLENYRFGEDKQLYHLSHQIGLRSYSHRMIRKAKDRNRWRINGEWWSERQLKPHLKLDENPIKLKNNIELPF